jgi:hypothetical protein
LLIAAVAACFWPGVAMYDTVAQYGQVLGDPVTDWHPPVMVRLWQLLHRLADGTAPMFVLQITLYGAGFSLFVAALTRSGRRRAAIAAALLALSPLLLGWQMVVLKDAQMLGALVAAFGIVAHYRLASRRVPVAAGAVVALLFAYATLVRANAIFATIPLVVLVLPTCRRPLVTGALAIAGAALVLALTPLINHRLLGAAPSDVAKSLPIFDLAAIAVSTADSAPFTSAERAEIVERHCVKTFFWDPLGDPTGCPLATRRLMRRSAGQLYLALAGRAGRDPIAYARHRLAHWNSTERWLVAPGLPDAAPPADAEPNELGLETPASPAAAAWQDTAAAEAATPLGWPIVWTFVALSLLPVAWRRRGDPAGGLALALLASALTLEFSFIAISIASDIRYHLWAMTATTLALILLSDDPRLKRRERIAAAGILALMICGGIIARSTLPTAPDSYEGMIHAASG